VLYFIDGKRQINTFTKPDGSVVMSHVLLPRSIALDVVRPRVKVQLRVAKKADAPRD